MVEMTYKQIGGILLALIVLGSGGVYIKEASGYKTCSTGWILQEDGRFECDSRDLEPQYCYRFSNPNSEGISSRCYLGVLSKFEDVNIVPSLIFQIDGDYTVSPDGKTCYAQGNLKRNFKCNGGQ